MLNLLDRMKLPFRKDREFLSALHEILGFYPHNIEIYRVAFSHKSLSYHRPPASAGRDRRGRGGQRSENTSRPLNNERLEFLGDAVLETVVSDILFHHFDHKREGFLTATRAKIVQRESLNSLSARMGLDRLVRAAQGTRMTHTNIGGNAFEALMGAIYLDRGFKFCHWFIEHRVIGPYVDLDGTARKEVNFKSKLLEWSQKNRINTHFRDTANGESGFRTVIVIEGITLGKGSGHSKKESQQLASKDALLRMRKDAKVYDSIFRAKEKRTAMEADESFALPKIDEIEDELRGKNSAQRASRPVLEERKGGKVAPALVSDDAYAAAYDSDADYEVIDTPAADLPDYSRPAAGDEAGEAKPKRRRGRSRGAKTVGDAVKGMEQPAAAESAKEEKPAAGKQSQQRPARKSAAKGAQEKSAAPAGGDGTATESESAGEGKSRTSRRRPRKSAAANEVTLPALPALDSDEGVVLPAPVRPAAEPSKEAPNISGEAFDALCKEDVSPNDTGKEAAISEMVKMIATRRASVPDVERYVKPKRASAPRKDMENAKETVPGASPAAPSAETAETAAAAVAPAIADTATAGAAATDAVSAMRRLSLDEVVFGAESAAPAAWGDAEAGGTPDGDTSVDVAADGDSAKGDATSKPRPRRRGGRRRGSRRPAAADGEAHESADDTAAGENTPSTEGSPAADGE